MNYVVVTVLALIVALLLTQAWAMMESTKRREEAARGDE